MNTCDACSRAQRNPHTGLFAAGCRGCQARMLAQSPAFWQALQAGEITALYGEALRKVFGESWESGHAAVKHWHRLLTRTVNAAQPETPTPPPTTTEEGACSH